MTNEEDADAEFLYGSFDKASPDGQVSVPAGKTVKVETSAASWTTSPSSTTASSPRARTFR